MMFCEPGSVPDCDRDVTVALVLIFLLAAMGAAVRALWELYRR